MLCALHNDRIAVTRCTHCRIPVCAECQVILKGQSYCEHCSSLNLPGIQLNEKRNPLVALILSLCIPGLGQAYNGEYLKAYLIVLFSWMILPWIYGIYDAFRSARLINSNKKATSPSVVSFVTFILFIFLLVFSLYKGVSYMHSSSYEERAVQKNLQELSNAAEKYFEDYARYPLKESDLLVEDNPYLDELFCDMEIQGYLYSCTFSQDGYTITAELVGGESESAKWVVSTGGDLRQGH